ncbi:PDZ domain-containing protein [Antrihabitans sp. YC3-6]|uniref:endopeptidase La n=1 Tax=Antrihabitans stalagmiti TaxID=2799499 RepID=A0A934U171_9NOCA|nr:PDZ domain-containing protein [Antrihabitans stalagmiti]MBJ8338324.1 PDZ domain-containing protein [Antrihabitans stalagmiti]
MNRRMLTLLVALVPVIALGVLGSVLKVPYAALGPGPTFNTLGEVEPDKPIVDVEGVPLDPTSGNLNMTTVSVRDNLTIFEAFAYWASGRQGLVPRSEIYPPDKTKEETEAANKADFEQSEDSAELAALQYLKYPMKLSIGGVGTDGPAKDALREGDELISINGVDVASVCGVQKAVSGSGPDSDATIRFRRDGVDTSAVVKLGARPGDPEKGYLGITPVEKPDGPVEVTFNLADVGGPSAGLMFSLAVIDKMSPLELSGGTFIAGTGTIDSCGAVGPIGGIPYKMIAAQEAGAKTFLVPAENCDEAKQRAPDGLRLVKVTTLDDAVGSLEAIRDGRDAPGC